MSEQIHDAGHTAGNAITRKLGPLPIWAWALILAGGYYAYHLYSTYRNGAATGLGSGTQTTAPNGAPAMDPTAGSNSVLGGGQYSGSVQSGPNGTPAMTTNAQWARTVADQLIALGDNPSQVETALSQYVNGQGLDATGSAIIDQALTKFGTPPEGVLPYQGSTTTPQSNYGAGTRYTVQQGDTFTSILQRFYGSGANPITARVLAAQNGLSWGGGAGTNFNIKPGQVLTLTPNGIAGVQGNTLNTYDPGHAVTQQDLKGFPAS